MTPKLTEAVRDAIFMFRDIEKARQLPPEAFAWRQYAVMAKLLETLLEEEFNKPPQQS